MNLLYSENSLRESDQTRTAHMDGGKPPMSRLAKRAQASGLTPIVVPVVNSPYALCVPHTPTCAGVKSRSDARRRGSFVRSSNSGTYTEGDFQIGADGLKLGSMENLQASAATSSR